MTGLIIALAILLFITLILLIRLKIVIDFHGDDVKLILKVLGIPIKLMPRKEKKKKLRLSEYSYKAIRKRKKKEERKKEKAALKAEKKSEKEAAKQKKAKEKQPLSETISFICGLVKYLLGKFFGHLRIDVTEIKITVGSEDAAKTAIMYGVISQATAVLLDILGAITNVKRHYKSEVAVTADFTAEKIRADINIAFSLRVWHAFSIALSALFRYIGNIIKKSK